MVARLHGFTRSDSALQTTSSRRLPCPTDPGRAFNPPDSNHGLLPREGGEKPAISYIIETAKGESSTWAGCSEKNVATTAVSCSRHSHRVQIGRLQHKPKSNGLLLQAGQVAAALPHDLAIQRVSIHLVAVFQCKAG